MPQQALTSPAPATSNVRPGEGREDGRLQPPCHAGGGGRSYEIGGKIVRKVPTAFGAMVGVEMVEM